MLPEEKQSNDEEVGIESKTPTPQGLNRSNGTKKIILGLLLALAVVALIVGLSVGLIQRNKDTPETASDTASSTATGTTASITNPNLQIFDMAAALLKATPRQSKLLPSGETMSYREFHIGQPHVLVVLPGYGTDDTMASLLAVMPQYQDHHIVAVDPIGWNGSTMNTPIDSHKDNAVEVIELLKLIGIDQAMAMGYSTGGGIAFYLAHKYPDVISAAFLMHSIPLDGMHTYTGPNGTTIFLNSIEEVKANMAVFPEGMKQFCSILRYLMSCYLL